MRKLVTILMISMVPFLFSDNQRETKDYTLLIKELGHAKSKFRKAALKKAKALTKEERKKLASILLKSDDPELKWAGKELLPKKKLKGLELAKDLYKKKQYEQCRDELEKILVQNPYDIDAIRLLKRVYQKMDDRFQDVKWKWRGQTIKGLPDFVRD